MNKSDLVDALADSAGMTKADASRALDSLFGSQGVIAKALGPSSVCKSLALARLKRSIARLAWAGTLALAPRFTSVRRRLPDSAPVRASRTPSSSDTGWVVPIGEIEGSDRGHALGRGLFLCTPYVLPSYVLPSRLRGPRGVLLSRDLAPLPRS